MSPGFARESPTRSICSIENCTNTACIFARTSKICLKLLTGVGRLISASRTSRRSLPRVSPEPRPSPIISQRSAPGMLPSPTISQGRPRMLVLWRDTSLIVRIRGPLVILRRVLLQFVQQDLDSLFELRVPALAPGCGVKFDLDVGGHAVIFNLPFSVQAIDSRIWRGYKTAVH